MRALTTTPAMRKQTDHVSHKGQSYLKWSTESLRVTMLNTTLDLLLRYTLFIAATTAPNLSSAAVITTGISTPVLTTSAWCLAAKSGSKGKSAPGAVSVTGQRINILWNSQLHSPNDYIRNRQCTVGVFSKYSYLDFHVSRSRWGLGDSVAIWLEKQQRAAREWQHLLKKKIR